LHSKHFNFSCAGCRAPREAKDSHKLTTTNGIRKAPPDSAHTRASRLAQLGVEIIDAVPATRGTRFSEQKPAQAAAALEHNLRPPRLIAPKHQPVRLLGTLLGPFQFELLDLLGHNHDIINQALDQRHRKIASARISKHQISAERPINPRALAPVVFSIVRIEGLEGSQGVEFSGNGQSTCSSHFFS